MEDNNTKIFKLHILRALKSHLTKIFYESFLIYIQFNHK